MTEIVVNGAFRGQRVTGQQRYATEVARHLEGFADVESAAPTGFWAGSTLRVWIWVQLILPYLARGRVVVSMTSRAPIWYRRSVLVVHDLFVLTNPEWYSRRYVWTHAPILRAQLRSALAVVAVSQPVAEQLAAYRSDPVAVAPNAPSEEFDSRYYEDPDDEAVRRHGLIPDSYFLAVGSRDPRKNLPRLLAAYGALAEEERAATPLVLIGGSNSIYRDETLDIPQGVFDAGYVPDQQLRQLYRHARAVVLVSLDEGFGLPLIEAALAGARGLLVSDLPIFRWVCSNAARYVSPLSEEDITSGLRREISDPQQLEFDVDRFTWRDSAATLRLASGRGRVCA